MSNDRSDRIRQRAFDLWVQQGQPHGRQEDHWRQAEAELSAGDETAAPNAGAASLSEGPADQPDVSSGADKGSGSGRSSRGSKTTESAGGLPADADLDRSSGASALRGGPQHGAVDPVGSELGSREDLD